MTGNIAALRYAKALFNLAKSAGPQAMETYGRELGLMVDALGASPDLRQVFRSPAFSAEEKKAVLRDIGKLVGISSAATQNFLNLLTDKGRLGSLEDIFSAYSALLDDFQGVIRGELFTAIELPESRREEILERLAQKLGRKPALDFEVDDAIIGGVILKIGDKVLDASLRAQLTLLKDQIKRGE